MTDNPLSPAMRDFHLQRRQMLLGMVDAEEKLLGISRTADARRYAKDRGWKGEAVTNQPADMVDASEEMRE